MEISGLSISDYVIYISQPTQMEQNGKKKFFNVWIIPLISCFWSYMC